jgi:hypothetical protein
MGGPIQKQMAKAIPTCASAFDLVAWEVTSESIALREKSIMVTKEKFLLRTHIASWTFPSLSPPITRESAYEANVVDFTHLDKSRWCVCVCRYGDDDLHKSGEYVPNHGYEENAFTSIFIGKRADYWRNEELEGPVYMTQYSNIRITGQFDVREGRTHKPTKKYNIPSFGLPTGDV